MRIGKGVEWAVHSCALMALLPRHASLPGEALAAFLDVPQPYLAKQLQALSRAGIVSAQRGTAGGYRLARPPEEVSLWDITAALEGTAPNFRCTEVRRNGPCGASPTECRRPCDIAAAFARAEADYRATLAAVPLSEMVAGASQSANEERKRNIRDWLEQEAASRS